MNKEPLISVICPSNRIFLWESLYNAIKEYSNDILFEIIIVGPCEPDFSLHSSIKYIKTNNIKVPQCNEIAMRNAQGKMFLIFGDDQKFWDNGLFCLYEQYNKLCEKRGNNEVVILPPLRVRGSVPRLRYGRLKEAPISSLNSALFDRELYERFGGVDLRFLGVYWDCDLAMRFNQAGVKISFAKDMWCVEFGHKKKTTRLHRPCKPYDTEILNSFWVRRIKKGEKVPSDNIWCYAKKRRHIISKKRLKDFKGYDEKNILLYSQGPKKIEGLEWE